MTARWWTIGILAVVTILLIAWDVYAATNKERGDTISDGRPRVCSPHPVIPFLMGVLMGHLLWPQ